MQERLLGFRQLISDQQIQTVVFPFLKLIKTQQQNLRITDKPKHFNPSFHTECDKDTVYDEWTTIVIFSFFVGLKLQSLSMNLQHVFLFFGRCMLVLIFHLNAHLIGCYICKFRKRIKIKNIFRPQSN